MEPNGRFVIVELMGGLGNQLFQYAAARALCLRERRSLHFAWQPRVRNTQRDYLLDRMKLGADVPRAPLSPAELRRLGLFDPVWRRALGKVWPLPSATIPIVQEQSFAYAPVRAPDQGGFVMRGYFQSWRHFEDATLRLRAELVPAAAPVGLSREILDRLSREPASVCVHVRRGDYASDKAARAYHGLLNSAHYDAACAAVEAGPNATYYVFSDDAAWAAAHVRPPGPTTYVAHNSAAEPWEDLRLMAACRHFVIANSSFSWWGAWLSPYADKRVVAPKRWFAGASAPSDTSDLCPPKWIRL